MRANRGTRIAATLLLSPIALMLSACAPSGEIDTSADSREPPLSTAPADDADADVAEPSIQGTITDVSAATIRVEEDSEEPSGSAKAVVRLTDETTIRRRGGSPATRGDIHIGDTVRVWFIGAVEESYPVQATAGIVELIAAGN
jgi:hypothetical protein